MGQFSPSEGGSVPPRQQQEPGDAIPEPLYDAILQCPSIFGRIVQVAAIRDQMSAANLGEDTSRALAEALARLHLETFRTWLTYPVRQQAADIRIYFNQRKGQVDKQQLMTGERYVPPDAEPMEKQLFLKDLKIVQILISYNLEVKD